MLMSAVENRTTVTSASHRDRAASYDHLAALEAESVHIMREVVAEFERPVLLFSGGKDSIVMLELARKAFAPARIPFPVMHVDTGLNFPEVLAFRDQRVSELGVHLIVASVEEAIARAAGLTACRLDGSPLVYNADDPWLPDLVVCRPELAEPILAAVRSSS